MNSNFYSPLNLLTTKGAILFFLIYIWLPLSAEEQAVPALLIYDFYSPQKEFPTRYGYLSNTISDIIRETLLKENAFYLIEKEPLRLKLQEEEKDLKEELNRLAIARALNSDYFIWGYYIMEEERIIVFFQLQESFSGRTVHIEKRELPLGFELFDEVDQGAKEFSGWINVSLPERFQTLIKERPRQETKIQQNGISLELGPQYNFFLPPFNDYLIPNAAIKLNVLIREPETWFYGFSLGLGILTQPPLTENPVSREINLLFLPLTLKGGFSVNITDHISMDISAELGGALMFGVVSGDVVSYFRFTTGADLLIFLKLSESLKCGIGCSSLFTVAAYDNWLMTNLSPEIIFSLSL